MRPAVAPVQLPYAFGTAVWYVVGPPDLAGIVVGYEVRASTTFLIVRWPGGREERHETYELQPMPPADPMMAN